MKKILTSILAATMLLTGTMGVQASEIPVQIKSADDFESIELNETQKKTLEQYQRVFIDTGMFNEFTLNEDGALTTSQNYTDLQHKYNVSENDIQFVQDFVQANQDAVRQAKHGIRTRMQVKNFRVYLTYKETKSYLGTVVVSGPIAVIGALAALGMTVGGPAGAVISGVAGLYGANYVVITTRKAINQKRGVWVGWGGIGIN